MIEIIQIVGMTFSFFLALVLIRKKKFLYYGVVFICCGLILLEKYFWQTGYINKIPVVAEVFVPLSFSIPIWLFLGSRSFKSVKSKAKWILLIIPLLPYLNFLPLYAANTQYKLCYIQYEIMSYLPDKCQAVAEMAPTLISDSVLDLVLIIEFILLLLLFNPIKGKTSADKSGKTQLVSNKWSIVLFIIVCFALGIAIIGILFTPETMSLSSYSIPVIGILTCLFIVNNSVLFLDIVKSKAYVNLSEDETKNLYQIIDSTLNERTYYTNVELTLVSLAQDLNLSANKLSYVLKSNNTSFKNLLNSIRIQKATEFMKTDESKNFSIEGIANMFGYKSKSTFYQNFKTLHAKTPKEFIKEYKNSSKT